MSGINFSIQEAETILGRELLDTERIAGINIGQDLTISELLTSQKPRELKIQQFQNISAREQAKKI